VHNTDNRDRLGLDDPVTHCNVGLQWHGHVTCKRWQWVYEEVHRLWGWGCSSL